MMGASRTGRCRFRSPHVGVLLLLSCLASTRPAAGQETFTVTTTDDVDDGACDAAHCSLREALTASSSADGASVIAFDIPGAGPHTIRPASPLPPLGDDVLLDGTTEPDWAGAPVIELDGSGAGEFTHGLVLLGSGSTVRGLVVNRFDGTGVEIADDADGNRVEGCYLGTDVTGTSAQGNGNAGVVIGRASDNVIGGADPEDRNVLSGNDFGVFLPYAEASENRILGNYIGTDVTGSAAVPNTTTGILLWSRGTVIGGAEDGAGNVISGNLFAGIDMGEGTTGTIIRGNLIGTDAGGTVALGNDLGIFVNFAPDNVIGGIEPGAGNVISGNNGDGMAVNGAGASGNLIVGNLIGTDGDGTSPVPNAIGIHFYGAPDNTVGGTEAGAGNVISGNGRNGIRFEGAGSTGNRVLGNRIGTDASGAEDLGNGTAGVALIQGAENNEVGSPDPGGGNVIAHNGRRGITLTVNAGSGNAIRSSAFFDNEGVGIELGNDGATPNDPDDSDEGPNGYQNHPELETLAAGGDVAVRATLLGAPSGSFELDFFSNDACDQSGYGEGHTPLGSATLATDASGSGSVTAGFSGVEGTVLTATATDVGGSTSEFSACSDLVTLGASPSPTTRTVSPGETAEYTLAITTAGGTFDGTATLGCSGQPGGTTCTVQPAEVDLSTGAATATLTVPTVAPAGLPRVAPGAPAGRPRGWLPLLALLGLMAALSGWVFRPRAAPAGRRLPALVLGATASAILLLAPLSCGDDGVTEPSGGTAPGSYDLVVTAGWASVEASAIVTLVVR
ncbi:MAG: CSLREA domain-containing protein [Gemmatimonadota bacterium]|jgi:CSLREA domain-containing protein